MSENGVCKIIGMFALSIEVVLAIILLFLVGCTTPNPQYYSVPFWLIPEKPNTSPIQSELLACLSDDVYTKLVLRDRACWQHVRELRALLGASE